MELGLVMQLRSQPRMIVSWFSVVPAEIEKKLCASAIMYTRSVYGRRACMLCFPIFVTYYGAVWIVRKVASNQALFITAAQSDSTMSDSLKR